MYLKLVCQYQMANQESFSFFLSVMKLVIYSMENYILLFSHTIYTYYLCTQKKLQKKHIYFSYSFFILNPCFSISSLIFSARLWLLPSSSLINDFCPVCEWLFQFLFLTPEHILHGQGCYFQAAVHSLLPRYQCHNFSDNVIKYIPVVLPA